MKEKISGIYCIENKVNGKKYIGQSKDILYRLRKHKEALLRNNHDNQYLQNSWNKHGEFSFEFDIVEQCLKENLDEKEIYYIDFYKSKSNKNGYNIADGGNRPKTSIETIRKMLESRKWYKVSEETKEKIRKAFLGDKNHMFGKTHSPEARKKISDAHKGRKSLLAGKKKSNIHSSDYYGVCFVSSVDEYFSQIGINGVNINIGWYKDEIICARSYDNYILKNKIKDRNLNFPESIDETLLIFKNKRKGKIYSCKSAYYGVGLHTMTGKWQVSITINSKKIYIGLFEIEEDAARVYDSVIINNGLNKPLNFPEDYS